jgi:uncharacterized repeat protein (TIGR02543 family)
MNGEQGTTYTISYDPDGATAGTAPADQTKTAGTDLTLAENTGGLARDGFTFSGWNTAEDGSGTSYAEGATYSDDADLTLYAEWNDTAPSAPSAVSTSALGGEVSVSWDDPPAGDLDRIEITWTPADGENQPVSVDPGVGTYTVTGLGFGTSYTFTLRAVDGGGNQSSEATAGDTTLSRLSAGTDIASPADSNAVSVYATDLDGDGDADVLSASQNDDRIVWYDNQTTD